VLADVPDGGRTLWPYDSGSPRVDDHPHGAHRRRQCAEQPDLQLSHNLSAYNASYVALAEALRCPLSTRGARIGRASGYAPDVEVL
jgi:hypothetical protein